MDSQRQMISIPIQEYENYRNILSLQDKQAIIRDLQKLLLNKEEDLQRYKDKCELQESVLERTQKALDKCIQSEQAHASIPFKTSFNRQQRGLIPLKRSDSKSKSVSNTSGAIEVVSRAVGDESTPAASLPDRSSRPMLIDDSSNIKSLPPNMSIGSPGMSTALLKRLVQENLKLKAQIDRRHLSKPSKNVEELEKIINDLKVKLMKKQQIVDDLLNQSGNEGIAASRLEALHKEKNGYMDTIEMDKIVINALKQENAQYKKDKDEMENLLTQYRRYKTVAEENDEKVADLEKELRDEAESRKAAEAKIESYKQEIEKLKQALEKAEEDRELAVKNYNTLSSKYHKSPDKHPASQPAFMVQAPLLAAAQHPSEPLSLPPQGYNYSQPTYTDTHRAVHPRSHMSGRSPPPQLPVARKPSDGSAAYGAPKTFTQPLQESTRMSQSAYMAPTYQTSQSPLPTERKTFKCPRCDTKFMLLQGYRDHIKACLKG